MSRIKNPIVRMAKWHPNGVVEQAKVEELFDDIISKYTDVGDRLQKLKSDIAAALEELKKDAEDGR